MIHPRFLALGLLTATASPGVARDDPPPERTTRPRRVAPKAAADAIVVTGRRPAVERTAEGSRYDLRDSASGQAGSAADVLNTLPSVSVSPDGAISVRGNSQVQVYVNGRPSAAMNGDNRGAALQAMSGASIASVEVITTPSARLDANGGAIVNIELKKGQGEGLHAELGVNAGDRGRRNGRLDMRFGRGRVSASLNASLRDAVRLTRLRDDKRIDAADGSPAAHLVSETRYTPTHRRSASLAGALAYAVKPDSEIGLDLSWSRGSPKNRVFERHRDEGGSGIVSEYRRVRGGSYVSGDRDLALHYERKGGAGGSTLKLAAQHGRATLRADRLFTTFRDSPPSAPSGERILNRSRTRLDRVAIDHERPVGPGLRLGLGAEYRREQGRFDNGRAAFDPKGPLPPLAPARFATSQHSLAGYASLQLRSGPWTLQASERFEDLRIETALDPGAFTGRRRLDGLNHSLSIARALGEDQAILRLSRSRQRFDPRDLNPAIVYVDAQYRSTGNPWLSPQDVTAGEAEYGFRRGGLEGAATVYYRRTDDLIADFTRIQADNLLIVSKRNGGRSQSFGTQLTLSGKIGGALKFSLTGNLFRADLGTAGAEGGRRALLTYAAQASLDWSATPRDQLHLDADLGGPSLVPQGFRTGTSEVNLVWRHALSPHWKFSLSVQGVVLDDHVRTTLRTARAVAVNHRWDGGRAIFAGLAWKIR